MFDIGVTQGRVAAMTAGGIAVSIQAASAHHLRLGSHVVVAFPTTGRQTLAVQAIYTQHLAGAYVVTLAGAAPNFPQRLDFQIYAKLAPGVSPSAGRQAVEA